MLKQSKVPKNNRMYKKQFIVEVSLTNKQYSIAKSLGVPIKEYIGSLSSMAKIKRKKRNEK
jgi:hypothetical protein